MNKSKCVGCGTSLPRDEMEEIDIGVDPIDMGEFGGVMTGYICEECSRGGGCDCRYGCFACEPESHDVAEAW